MAIPKPFPAARVWDTVYSVCFSGDLFLPMFRMLSPTPMSVRPQPL